MVLTPEQQTMYDRVYPYLTKDSDGDIVDIADNAPKQIKKEWAELEGVMYSNIPIDVE